MRPFAVLAVLVLVFGASVVQAGENPFKKTEEKPVAPQPAPPAPKPGPKPDKTPQGRGSFKVAYGPVKDTDYKEIQKVFRETRILEDTAQALNEAFLLPTDVTITMNACGEENAYYEADKKKITLCYELIAGFSNLFLADAES